MQLGFVQELIAVRVNEREQLFDTVFDLQTVQRMSMLRRSERTSSVRVLRMALRAACAKGLSYTQSRRTEEGQCTNPNPLDHRCQCRLQ